jgi:hypothetical protein
VGVFALLSMFASQPHESTRLHLPRWRGRNLAILEVAVIPVRHRNGGV